MCLGIKEGQYPPAAPLGKGSSRSCGPTGGECCSHRLYVYMFVHNICWGVSGACGTYTVFLQRDSLGLTLGQIGFIGAAVSGVQMFLSYPLGSWRTGSTR